MSFPIEAAAAALAQTLRRVEPDITADHVDTMSLAGAPRLALPMSGSAFHPGCGAAAKRAVAEQLQHTEEATCRS